MNTASKRAPERSAQHAEKLQEELWLNQLKNGDALVILSALGTNKKGDESVYDKVLGTLDEDDMKKLEFSENLWKVLGKLERLAPNEKKFVYNTSLDTFSNNIPGNNAAAKAVLETHIDEEIQAEQEEIEKRQRAYEAEEKEMHATVEAQNIEWKSQAEKIQLEYFGKQQETDTKFWLENEYALTQLHPKMSWLKTCKEKVTWLQSNLQNGNDVDAAPKDMETVGEYLRNQKSEMTEYVKTHEKYLQTLGKKFPNHLPTLFRAQGTETIEKNVEKTFTHMINDCMYLSQSGTTRWGKLRNKNSYTQVLEKVQKTLEQFEHLQKLMQHIENNDNKKELEIAEEEKRTIQSHTYTNIEMTPNMEPEKYALAA